MLSCIMDRLSVGATLQSSTSLWSSTSSFSKVPQDGPSTDSYETPVFIWIPSCNWDSYLIIWLNISMYLYLLFWQLFYSAFFLLLFFRFVSIILSHQNRQFVLSHLSISSFLNIFFKRSFVQCLLPVGVFFGSRENFTILDPEQNMVMTGLNLSG